MIHGHQSCEWNSTSRCGNSYWKVRTLNSWQSWRDHRWIEGKQYQGTLERYEEDFEHEEIEDDEIKDCSDWINCMEDEDHTASVFLPSHAKNVNLKAQVKEVSVSILKSSSIISHQSTARNEKYAHCGQTDQFKMLYLIK